MKIFAIYDKRNKEFLINGTKGAWLTKGAAKNAIMFQLSSLDKNNYQKKLYKEELTKDWLENNNIWERRYLSFHDQTRYECREYLLNDSYVRLV